MHHSLSPYLDRLLFVITLTPYQSVGMNLHDEVLEIIGRKHEMVFFDDDPHQWPQPLDDCYNRLFVSASKLRRAARYICDLAASIAVEDARSSEKITALAKPWSQTQTAVASKYGTTRQAVAKRVKRLFPERENSAKLSKRQTIILCADLEKRPPRRKNQKKN